MKNIYLLLTVCLLIFLFFFYLIQFGLDFCESENKETDNFLEYDEILWQIAQTGCT